MDASSTPSPPNPSTFTTMPDKDLEAIGAHCNYTYCNQLDFLPFRCESCKGTYCLEHRTETAHKCAHAGEWAAAKRKAANGASTTAAANGGQRLQSVPTQCSHPVCKTNINTHNSVGVGCPTCNRQYCLKHRLKEDHACSTLPPLGARQISIAKAQAQSMDKAKSALARLKVWGKERQAAVTPKPKASSAAGRVVALNNLKKTAKGDEKVPVEKRVYLRVEAEAATTTSKLPRGEFWYNKEWSIGRLLDAAAKGLQVQNINNRGGGEEEKLRVFHVEGGRLLDFGEKLENAVVNGNTVVLLRGVGPAAANTTAV